MGEIIKPDFPQWGSAEASDDDVSTSEEDGTEGGDASEVELGPNGCRNNPECDGTPDEHGNCPKCIQFEAH